ncbi:MAG: GNAT family N-acetyltransferase [Desulfarculus sp.]|nr:GNAT family N-acetyltransferase [Desulfarculus sp.]
MAEISAGAPLIREMRPSDLDQIVEIDRKVLGKSRRDYWEIKLRLVQNRAQFAALVAEIDGRVIGFIIGGASRWEYGVPENVGWIDTIGVDPDHQRQGVAKLLFREMVDHLKQLGVVSIRTFVKRLDWKLLKFFEEVGFSQGDMVNLELDI